MIHTPLLEAELVPRLDYFQASVRADYDVVLGYLVSAFGDGELQPSRGIHGYGLGWKVPTRERGTLTVNPPGMHEFPAVRVSGWPTDDVVDLLRAHWEGQASRVDAAVDFTGDMAAWCEVLTAYAQGRGMKWGSYHVGEASTGVELGARSSESRTRCYDAALAHPGEFNGPTYRLEHEWKPSQKSRKELAWSAEADLVLGTSKAAARVMEQLGGCVLPAAPARTERVAELEAWVEWFQRSQGGRMRELLERFGGDRMATFNALLGEDAA